jgi:hypothetical protein
LDGPSPPKLNVTVTTDEPGAAGYAKVAAYLPIGPGGGVLTECTVHEAETDTGASTSQYGIVFGLPACRLPEEKGLTAASEFTEKE